MSLLGRDVEAELERILGARTQGTVYLLSVDGVPIVGVPLEDLIGTALDEAFPPDIAQWYPQG